MSLAPLAQMSPQEWAHFLSTASGVIIGSIPPVGVIITFILRLTRKIDTFLVEHEMLMSKYVRDKGITLEQLPTRSRRIF